MPTLCTVFYAIGRTYRFGSGRLGFPVKCLGEMYGERGAGGGSREGVSVVPGERGEFHVAGGERAPVGW